MLCLSLFPAFFHYPVLIFAFPSDQKLALTGVVVYGYFHDWGNQWRQLKLYLDIYPYKSNFNVFPKGPLNYKVVGVCENISISISVYICIFLEHTVCVCMCAHASVCR